MVSNIILTGFMGTGKTTTGRLLADKLGMVFVDTDAIIEERHGLISDIFRLQGEDAFRAIERELATELADQDGLVISTGGRMMLDPANIAALGRTGRVFCLVATPDEILERVSKDAARVERPLLAVADPYQRIVELLDERSEGYSHFPQVVTTGASPEAIVRDLIDLVADDGPV